VKLSIGSLTAKDRRDVAFAARAGVDYVAQSFVRPPDVRQLKSLLRRHGRSSRHRQDREAGSPGDLDAILREADGIMVARGDLGVELPAGRAGNPKRLIRRANEEEIPVITATQMLESMIEHARPTRAEASDVANAIFDGTDAVMLSAETAAGAPTWWRRGDDESHDRAASGGVGVPGRPLHLAARPVDRARGGSFGVPDGLRGGCARDSLLHRHGQDGAAAVEVRPRAADLRNLGPRRSLPTGDTLPRRPVTMTMPPDTDRMIDQARRAWPVWGTFAAGIAWSSSPERRASAARRT
jgi:hypothetical protein